MSESTRSQIEKLEKQMVRIKARLVSENAKIRHGERFLDEHSSLKNTKGEKMD